MTSSGRWRYSDEPNRAGHVLRSLKVMDSERNLAFCVAWNCTQSSQKLFTIFPPDGVHMWPFWRNPPLYTDAKDSLFVLGGSSSSKGWGSQNVALQCQVVSWADMGRYGQMTSLWNLIKNVRAHWHLHGWRSRRRWNVSVSAPPAPLSMSIAVLFIGANHALSSPAPSSKSRSNSAQRQGKMIDMWRCEFHCMT